MEQYPDFPDGTPQSAYGFIWTIWRAFPLYVFFRDGHPLSWLLGVSYVVPVAFLIPRFRAAFSRSWAAPLAYLCVVFVVALACTALELVSAIRRSYSGGMYESEEHIAGVVLWPASAIVFGVVFLLFIAVLRRSANSNVA